MIRYHSFPPHAIDDPDGKRKLLAIAANGQLCSMFSIELLCILCQADALGRECGDKTHMQEQIALCAELAEENGCFHSPFPFPSEHTRYSYLSGRDVAPEVELYNDTWGEVILMSGLPGTGKDTWIKENCPDLPMISLDEIRKEMKVSPTENQSKVVEVARERAKELLRKKQPFVWNSTNISPIVRGKQIRLFAQYHDRKVSLCHFPVAEWNGKRRGGYHVHGHLHNRRDEVFEFMSRFDKALNAGCMLNDYRPVTLDELIENNMRFREVRSSEVERL